MNQFCGTTCCWRPPLPFQQHWPPIHSLQGDLGEAPMDIDSADESPQNGNQQHTDPGNIPLPKEFVAKPANCDTIYVTGLSGSTNRHLLFQIFTPIGSIRNAKVIYNKMTGCSRRFGFVRFASQMFALRALARKDLVDPIDKTPLVLRRYERRRDFPRAISAIPYPTPANSVEAPELPEKPPLPPPLPPYPNSPEPVPPPPPPPTSPPQPDGFSDNPKSPEPESSSPSIEQQIKNEEYQQKTENSQTEAIISIQGLRSTTANEVQVRDLFCLFGTIRRVRVCRRKKEARIHFEHQTEAQEAIETMDGSEWRGREMRCRWWEGKQEKNRRKIRRKKAKKHIGKNIRTSWTNGINVKSLRNCIVSGRTETSPERTLNAADENVEEQSSDQIATDQSH